MNSAINHTNTPEEQHGINPTKFVVWLLIVASIMLFASFTSAYIVRRGEGNWLSFDIPFHFAVSCLIAVTSSISMHWAYQMAKKDELNKIKTGLFVTILLGVIFCFVQFLGWKSLVANNIHFVGNPSESFFYVISGVHLVHVLGGIIFLLVTFIKALQYKVHKKNLLTIQLCTTYWHFLGVAWIYLYFFLLLNR